MNVSAAPALPVVELRECRACGGCDLVPLALRYEFRDRTFPLVECRTCGMRFLSVQPAPAALAELYGAPYFERDFRCGRSDAGCFDEAAFRGENEALLDAFARLRKPGRLLEVGCAGGWLLEHARRRGWSVRGVEVSEEGVRHARGLGLEVVHGDLVAARLPDASADLVYMGDVLEHVPDCAAVLREVRRVLVPGGHLYLRGPITTHSLARSLALALYRAIGRTIVLREPPYHLWEFRPRPLARLLNACALEVRSVRQSKIPPGRAHGAKSPTQTAAMAVIDAANLPLTALLNVRGDRAVVVARAA
jgi:2-polyprenyl-3-methyl-5-hydroxy-6-metoxy-1,4-benzoquinol methylase